MSVLLQGQLASKQAPKQQVKLLPSAHPVSMRTGTISSLFCGRARACMAGWRVLT